MRFGAAFQALSWVLLSVLAAESVAAKSSGDAPKVHHTYFKESLSKLFYFKNPASLLGIDRAGGKIYRSSDHGARWEQVTEIPNGKAAKLYGHPYEPKIAYVLSAGTEHWVTHDEGKTWAAFSTPVEPTSSGERPLVFHAERTGWILFIGERCKDERGGWWPFPKLLCHDEVYYTKDGFAKAVKDHKAGDKTGGGVTSLLGNNKPVARCIWAHQTKEFEAMAEEAIFCLEIAPESEASNAKQKRALPGITRSTATLASALGGLPKVHQRDILYPHAKRSSGNADDGILASAKAEPVPRKRGLFDDAISALENQPQKNTVRLVVSEDFFDTKRIVHFGSGNDGSSGDKAGGGVLAVSIVKRYILVAISHAHSNEMDLFISLDGHIWAESHLPLPPGTEEDAYTILESTEHSVFVDVVTSDTKAVGTLFRSNSNGTYYTQSLEHTHRDKDGLVDVERVHGVEGVVIANQVSNWNQIGKGGVFHRDKMELRSRISFNDGARWRFLQPPEKDIDGKKYGCSVDGWHTGECALHVHSVTSTRSPGRIFGAPSSAGVLLAVGNVGPKLLHWRQCDTFLSRDGGISWQMVHRDAHHAQVADSGSVLVLVNDEVPTDVLNYSLDSGESWHTAPLGHKIRVKTLFIDDGGLSPVVVAVGTVREGSHKHEQIVVAIDFSKSWSRKCELDPSDPKPGKDVERFTLKAHEGNDCVMGHRSEHIRRKPDAQCYMGLGAVLVPKQEDCTCTEHDFECDYNYALNSKGKCELTGEVVIPKGQCLKKGDRFLASSGYRHIPGNTCIRDKGQILDKPVDQPCPRVQSPNGGSHRHDGESDSDRGKGSTGHYGPVSQHISAIRGEVHITPFPNTTSYLMLSSASELYYSDSEGSKWQKVDLAKSTGNSKVGKPIYLTRHEYNNNRAFIYTDTDHLLYSSDRGATWKVVQNLPSPVNTLHVRPFIDFNPENPDWLLFVGGTACPGCHTEIYASSDNGGKWNRITTHATKCLFARAKQFKSLPPEAIVCTNYRYTSGKSNEQDRQRHKKSPGNYVEVRVFSKPFTESTFSHLPLPDPEHKDVVDFHIYSRFIVVAVIENKPDDAGYLDSELKLFVSEDGVTVHEARFPPGVNVKSEGFTLLPSHAGTILIDVENAPNTGDPQWGTGWGTLFASNSNGTHFHMVLQHTNRNHMGLVDFDRVDGLNGMLIANRVLNTEALGRPGVRKEIRTVASWDDGRTWHALTPPTKDSKGHDIDCTDCTLNLYGRSAMISAGPLYGVPTAPGYLIAVGSVGTHLGRYGDSKTYLTRDGGISWAEARGAETQYEFGDHGSLMVLIDDDGPTDTLWYSYDAGISWKPHRFTDGSSKVVVDHISNGLSSGGQKMLILGREVTSEGRVNTRESWTISVDFSKVLSRQCKLDTRDHSKSDFELWTPHWGVDSHGKDAPICVLGTETSYWRRKTDAACWVGNEFDLPETSRNTCECTVQDFECDEGFWLNDYGKCVLDGADPYQPDCHEGNTYKGRSGYRRIAMSQCKGGEDLEKPVDRICGRAGGLQTTVLELDSPISDIQYFKNSHHVLARTESGKVLYSFDEGGEWKDVKSISDHSKEEKHVPSAFATIIRHPYFGDYAYFVPQSGTVALYTADAAWTTQLLHLPTSPAHFYQPVLRFHPEKSDWIIFLGQPNENCKSRDDPNCQVEAFITKDHGAHWDALVAPVGPGGCSFLKTDRLTKAHKEAIVCARHPNAREGGGNLVVSEDWFTRHERVLVANATDFAIMGEFLLISEDSEDGKSLTMHISLDGKSAAVAKFPGNKHTLDPAYTVLEPPEGFEYRDEKGHNQKMPGGGLMLHVTKSDKPGAEWGTIYTSNSNGTYYRQTLEHVNRDENGLVDFERIRALEGVSIANVVSNPDDVAQHGKTKKLRTMITIDGGSRWHYLRIDGPTSCHQTAPKKGDCALHLHGYTEVSDPENIYSAAGAVGLLMGVGNVGSALSRIGEADTFLSRDGGATWELVRKGPMWHEFGDHGALIVAADRIHPIAEVEYSLDQGKTWLTLELPREAKSMRVEFLTTTPDSTSRSFVLYGTKDGGRKGVVVGLSFAGVQPRICHFDPLDEANHKNKDDFELFSPKPIGHGDSDDGCILGRKVQYYRRIADRQCYVGDEFRPARYVSSVCECTEKDYECNFNFVRASGDEDNPFGKCVLVKGMQAPRTNCTAGHKEYFEIEAPYRKIPQSVCRNGLVLDRPTEVWCPGKARAVAIFWSLFLPVFFLGLAYIGYQSWRRRYPYLRLEDIGTVVGPAVRNLGRPINPNAGLLKQVEPVFVGALATVKAVGNAAKEGLLWGLDRAAPYLPRSIQRWSYEHPPRWGAQLSMDGRSRREIRRGGESRYSYRPLGTNEAASRVFGTYDDAHGGDAFDEYDEFEVGFNHFLEEEQVDQGFDTGIGTGEGDAQTVDRQVLFANTEFSDDEEESDIPDNQRRDAAATE
ncbi:Oligoxyloglucan reducing end-specific cellobiohydrolase [Martensiomyces pterosporus]|nr:Oligoxyloglucan reducing end-specific cellobiohydrolase [Martensiomyces pterosporus]